jgi:hypothetical protein
MSAFFVELGFVIPGHGRLLPDVNPESRSDDFGNDEHAEIPGSREERAPG